MRKPNVPVVTRTSRPATLSNLPSTRPGPATRPTYSRFAEMAAPGGGSAPSAVAGSTNASAKTPTSSKRFIPGDLLEWLSENYPQPARTIRRGRCAQRLRLRAADSRRRQDREDERGHGEQPVQNYDRHREVLLGWTVGANAHGARGA